MRPAPPFSSSLSASLCLLFPSHLMTISRDFRSRLSLSLLIHILLLSCYTSFSYLLHFLGDHALTLTPFPAIPDSPVASSLSGDSTTSLFLPKSPKPSLLHSPLACYACHQTLRVSPSSRHRPCFLLCLRFVFGDFFFHDLTANLRLYFSSTVIWLPEPFTSVVLLDRLFLFPISVDLHLRPLPFAKLLLGILLSHSLFLFPAVFLLLLLLFLFFVDHDPSFPSLLLLLLNHRRHPSPFFFFFFSTSLSLLRLSSFFFFCFRLA